MDRTTSIALGLFVVACSLAIYQSRKENWTGSRKIGAAVFLVGAAVGLFLDDLVTVNSPVLPWIEPISALVMVAGLLVAWQTD